MALGYQSVTQCQDNISSKEFAEWIAYSRLEPFGADLFQVYFGTVAAAITNTTRSKKNDKIFQWHDFFQPLDFEETHQTTEEQLAIVEMLNIAFGGNDLRANKNPSTA